MLEWIWGTGQELGGAKRGWEMMGMDGVSAGAELGGAGDGLEDLEDCLDGSKMPGWNRESISAGVRQVFQNQSHRNWFLLMLLMDFCRVVVSEAPLWSGLQSSTWSELSA